MKFTIILFALASLAAAYPPQEPPKEPKEPKEPKRPEGPYKPEEPKRPEGPYKPEEPKRPEIPYKECKPGTYACLPKGNGWQVCNTSGKYVFAGECPPHTVCKFYKPSLSPYCVPPYFQFP